MYLGWSAVDLIRKEDTREYRSLAHLEGSLSLAIYLTSCEVRWEEVRGKRYTSSRESEYARECANRLGLTKSRNSLEECVSTCKKGDNELLDESILTDDILLYT